MKPFSSSHRLARLCPCLDTPVHAGALQGAHMYGRWDPHLVTLLLGRLTPDNARIDVQTFAWEGISEQLRQVTF